MENNVRQYYELIADEYAKEYFHEFDRKPFDRMVLERFSRETCGKGIVCDLGCGPGEVAARLQCSGASAMGIDQSMNMVRRARSLTSHIPFVRGDMFDLPLRDHSIAGIATFYAIVHCTGDDIKKAFREWRRVLQPGGVLLLSFHAGNEIVHVDEWRGIKASVDFFFFEPKTVLDALAEAGFTVRDAMIRYPYPGVEHESMRCYIFATV